MRRTGRHRERVVPVAAWSLALMIAIGVAAQAASASRPLVLVAPLDDIINPITAGFLIRAIGHAEQRQAACLVVLLDTPGGLVDATRDITKRMLDSAVPVVVYVSPPGSRAASAGLFITLAAHIAAMAPGTNIGAAHPVQVGGWPSPQRPPPQADDDEADADDAEAARRSSPIEDKALRDTAAWARALAELRGRNADWSARAVVESASATATEAAEIGVIDVVADDLTALLHRLDGRNVTVAHRTVTLQLANAEIEMIEMWWRDRLLSTLANPNLAFLLLMFGFYGILLELYTPGWGVGGTVGIICLVLAFFALAVLPVNHVGLALTAIGLALFVAEAFVTSYGFLTLGGVLSVTLGGLMLVDSPIGFLRVSPLVVVPVALATAAITVFLLGQVIKAHRHRAVTGTEGLVHERGVVDDAFKPQNGSYVGVVRVHGELWRAVCPVPLTAGEDVAIEKREGLTLHVRPAVERRADESPAQGVKPWT
jgi:membrane-bound serine protease (ClpP class)